MNQNKKVTVLDVAKRAGVSTGTVSRTLNNIGYIKKETREKILAVVEEMGYIPNRAGRALKTTRTGLIVLAIPDTANAIYVGMIEAVGAAMRKQGLNMVLYYTDATSEGELKAVRMLQENLVDALFLVNFYYSEALRTELEKCASPIVLCGMCVSPWSDVTTNAFDTVSIDVYRGIYDATAHLIELGHRRFAYLAGEKGPVLYDQRYQGFCDALSDHGLAPIEQFVFWGGHTEQDGFRAGKRLFADSDRPSALISSNDLQTLGFWKACLEQGVRIPEDIAVCSMDNLDICKILGLSSLKMWEAEMGREGARLLLDRLAGKKEGKSKNLSFLPTLMVRKSSGKPR